MCSQPRSDPKSFQIISRFWQINHSPPKGRWWIVHIASYLEINISKMSKIAAKIYWILPTSKSLFQRRSRKREKISHFKVDFPPELNFDLGCPLFLGWPFAQLLFVICWETLKLPSFEQFSKIENKTLNQVCLFIWSSSRCPLKICTPISRFLRANSYLRRNVKKSQFALFFALKKVHLSSPKIVVIEAFINRTQ